MPKNPAPESMPDDWRPDPERAFEDHDPDLEPYASMTREQVQAEMDLASRSGDHARWEMLQEFFLDKCDKGELDRINFSAGLAAYLMKARGTFGAAQAAFVADLAARTTVELFDGMPAPGPGHQIN
jgi:hypothetical protein